MPIPSPLLAPWAITDEGLKLVLAVATRGEMYSDVLAKARERYKAEHGDDPMRNDHGIVVDAGVAVIPVYGALVRHATVFSDISGATSYAGIRRQFDAALEDRDIKAIVFDIDSPGGEAFGCNELSNHIRESRGQKPIVSYASGMMCSAAYWIGSAADKVLADASAMIGCLGTRTLMVDTSEAEKQAGIVKYDIVSSQSPYKVADPAKESDRARVQQQMTDMAAVFIADVAKNRGVTEQYVKANYGKGDMLIGQLAVDAGLADNLSSLDAVVGDFKRTSKKGSFMASKPENKLYDAKCSGCRADMDDDDEMYCAACHSSSSAHASLNALLGEIGAKTSTEAVAIIAGLKQTASEVAAIREEQAKQAELQASRDFDAEIAKAKKDGLLASSDEHKRNKQALSYKGKPEALTSLRGFLGALDPLVPVGGKVAAPVEPPVVENAPSALTDEEKRIAAKMGLSFDKVLANKQRLAVKALSAPSSRPSADDDDAEDAA